MPRWGAPATFTPNRQNSVRSATLSLMYAVQAACAERDGCQGLAAEQRQSFPTLGAGGRQGRRCNEHQHLAAGRSVTDSSIEEAAATIGGLGRFTDIPSRHRYRQTSQTAVGECSGACTRMGMSPGLQGFRLRRAPAAAPTAAPAALAPRRCPSSVGKASDDPYQIATDCTRKFCAVQWTPQPFVRRAAPCQLGLLA